MTKRLRLKHGRVIDPASGLDTVTDLYIENSVLVGIGEAPSGFESTHEIDLSGRWVLPGLVDLSVHLRGNTLENTLEAALQGGVLHVVCTPDTAPILDEPDLVSRLKERANQLNSVHLHPLGALTRQLKGTALSELMRLAEAGCVGFSQVNAPLSDNQVLQRALHYAATFGYRVHLHPQDEGLAKLGVAHEGEVATRLGLVGIPVSAETVAISTILLLAEETGATVHLSRLSSAAGVELVRRAKAAGVPISCDISIQQVHLSEVDIGFFDTRFRLMPPLRSIEDRRALLAGLADGTIDAICSDHTAVDRDGKALPFAEAEAGAAALTLLLPLVRKWAEETQTPLVQALAKVTSIPAQLLGIQGGRFEVGQRAECCIVDPEAEWTVTPDGYSTPFEGHRLQGRVVGTLVKGIFWGEFA